MNFITAILWHLFWIYFELMWSTYNHCGLRHCAIIRKVAVSIANGVTGIFHWCNPAGLLTWCRVSFQNKFVKLVHLVDFMLKKMLRCTVTWSENSKHTFYVQQCFPENLAVCGIMWENIVEPDRPQMTIWLTCIARWITKATDTHSEYKGLIVFLLQQWLHEHGSMLHHT